MARKSQGNGKRRVFRPIVSPQPDTTTAEITAQYESGDVEARLREGLHTDVFGDALLGENNIPRSIASETGDPPLEDGALFDRSQRAEAVPASADAHGGAAFDRDRPEPLPPVPDAPVAANVQDIGDVSPGMGGRVDDAGGLSTGGGNVASRPTSGTAASGTVPPLSGGVATLGGRGNDIGLEGGTSDETSNNAADAGMSGGTMGGSRENDLGGGISGGMRSGMGSDAAGGTGGSRNPDLEQAMADNARRTDKDRRVIEEPEEKERSR